MLACEKKRKILRILQKCYFFIHFPILELIRTSRPVCNPDAARV